MKVAVVFGALVSAALAVTDCPTFESTCSSACSSYSNNQTINCNAFSSSCSCFELKPDVRSAILSNDLSKGKDFCSAQNQTCTSVVCGTQDYVDSFSCDPYSFTAECQCYSLSSKNGSAMMGDPEKECVSKMDECRKSCNDKVKTNVCYDPGTSKCECQGGSTHNQPKQIINGAGSLGFSAVFMALPLILQFF